MANNLETLIETVIALQDKKIFLAKVDEQYKAEYVKATKEKLYDRIYEEIKSEVREEAIKEAEKVINKRAELKKIDEFKKLMIEGFFAAIFVGLFVNQCTDIIGFFKGNVSLVSVWPTVFIAAGFLLLCIIIFGGLFVVELIKTIKKEYSDASDRS